MPAPMPCPNPCNVLLIGGGGREHALAWQLKQSKRLGKLYLTDNNNAALSDLGEKCPLELNLKESFRFGRWCDEAGINLIVVGPEVPLAEGITDALETDKRRVFGPTRAGAQLEADKIFAKQIMRQAAVPTGDARIFERLEDARHYLEVREGPCVVKASGLAAGKGVIVCKDEHEALAAVEKIMGQRSFGEAGAKILIEEFLEGQEVSILALVDGRTIWVLDPCQDHKQVGEGDTGPNTGGMGAYCPTPLLTEEMLSEIEREVLVPTVDALRREGVTYRGVLYAGLMLTPAGPKVLEFNCRFGDPECQPLMSRFRGDLVEVLWACSTGQLDAVDFSFDPRTACCVVMCAQGYPDSYAKGNVITGVEQFTDADDIHVFHAGTTHSDQKRLVTNGGRVLGVTALSDSLEDARDKANSACEKIEFEGAFFRRDIGDRVLKVTPKAPPLKPDGPTSAHKADTQSV